MEKESKLNGNAVFSILTSGDWKEFVDTVTTSEKKSLSHEDHGVWCDGMESESSAVIVRNQKDQSILAVVFFAGFPPNVEFFGHIFARKMSRETELAKKLQTEAYSRIETEDLDNDMPKTRIIYATGFSKSICFSLGFKPSDLWKLELVVAQNLQLSQIRRQGWENNIVLLNVDAIRNGRLFKYDRQVTFGIRRSNWLIHWLRHPTAQSKIALDENGDICGYGMLRAVNLGNPKTLCAGPIYADNANVAKAILYACLSGFGNVSQRNVISYGVANDKKMKEILVDEFQASVVISTTEYTPMFIGPEKRFDFGRVYSATDPVFSFI